MKIIILPTLLLAVLTTASAHYDYMNMHHEHRSQNHGPCRLGFKDGRSLVKYEWERDLDENCDEIWNLEEDAQRAANRKYRRGRTWREREYNRCARLGVKDAVKKYEDQCLNTTSDQCFDLAQAAAEAIVQQNVCDPPEMAKVPTTIDYKENCRTMAVNHCPANIRAVIDDWCPEKDEKMTTDQRLKLERKCGAEVDRLIQNA